MPMTVIVGVDDSKFSTTAIEHVAGLAWSNGARFLVVSAVAPIFLGPGEATAPDAISRLMVEQEKYHREIAERDAGRLRAAGHKADARVILGDPRTSLVEIANAEHGDLVVVGSHGRTGIKRLLLGSVAEYVVSHAPCSVLVVRETRHGR